MLLLLCALILLGAGAVPTLWTYSQDTTRVTSSHRHSLERLGQLSWNGTSLAIRTPAKSEEKGQTSLTVVVTNADTGQPINQARLTLEFTEPGDPAKLKRSKKLSYSAKTNMQGRYRFPGIPMGTIRLIVTAERHQTFSKEFELENENQTIEVKLKKPQPLL